MSYARESEEPKSQTKWEQMEGEGETETKKQGQKKGIWQGMTVMWCDEKGITPLVI